MRAGDDPRGTLMTHLVAALATVILMGGLSRPADAQTPIDVVVGVVVQSFTALPNIVVNTASAVSQAKDIVSCEERKSNLTELNANLNRLIVAKLGFSRSIKDLNNSKGAISDQSWREVKGAAGFLSSSVSSLSGYAGASARHFARDPGLSEVFIKLQNSLTNNKLGILRHFENAPLPRTRETTSLKAKAVELDKEISALRQASQEVARVLDEPCAPQEIPPPQ